MRSINKSLNFCEKVGFNYIPFNTTILFFFIKRKKGTL